MKKLKIGVLGPSEIAFRRMVPAILKSEKFEFTGVACADETEWKQNEVTDKSIIDNEHKKALTFIQSFGGVIYDSYRQLLESDVDAIYMPLPPALHYHWAKLAIKHGKHILVEKPLTTSLEETKNLTALTNSQDVAMHENFAFIYHNQIYKIKQFLNSGYIGELRLIRAAFGFPYRGNQDFRYNKSLGGGALLDCGGYPLKLASYLLGGDVKVSESHLGVSRGHDVDVFGSATLINNDNQIAQIAFGMDNAYKCDVEIWGSDGYLSTDRVYSPPADFVAKIKIKKGNCEEIVEIPEDDQFKNSLDHFYECISNMQVRNENCKQIIHQAELFEEIKMRKIK